MLSLTPSLKLVNSSLKLFDALVKFLYELLAIGSTLSEVLGVEAAGEDVHLHEGELRGVRTTRQLVVLQFQL